MALFLKQNIPFFSGVALHGHRNWFPNSMPQTFEQLGPIRILKLRSTVNPFQQNAILLFYNFVDDL
jgi:hypothetical protein